MADKIRIGMIGMGGFMNTHSEALGKIPDAHVVAITDTEPKNRADHKAHHAHLADANEYEDYRAMLDKEQLDAVVIATPHTTHFEQIMAALDRGLHVLVEKPMACRIDQGVEVVEKVRESGLTLVIGYQRHCSGVYRYIRRAIADGRIGKVLAVSCLQCQGWKEGTAGTWRQVPELSGGGQLNDSGSHLIDVLLWMTGLRAETVSAQIDNCGTPVDINSAISVRFTNGAVGTLTVIGDYPEADLREDISIVGDQGGFHIRDGRPLVQLLGWNDARLTVDAERLGGGSIFQNFIRCIQGEEEPAAPAECGLRVIELTEAAWKSAAAGGKPVAVPRTDL